MTEWIKCRICRMSVAKAEYCAYCECKLEELEE